MAPALLPAWGEYHLVPLTGTALKCSFPFGCHPVAPLPPKKWAESKTAEECGSPLRDDRLQRNFVRLRIDRLQSSEFEANTDGGSLRGHRGNCPIIEAAAIAEPVALAVPKVDGIARGAPRLQHFADSSGSPIAHHAQLPCERPYPALAGIRKYRSEFANGIRSLFEPIGIQDLKAAVSTDLQDRRPNATSARSRWMERHEVGAVGAAGARGCE